MAAVVIRMAFFALVCCSSMVIAARLSAPPPLRFRVPNPMATGSCPPFVSGPMLVAPNGNSVSAQQVNKDYFMNGLLQNAPLPVSTAFQACPNFQSPTGCPYNGENGLIFTICQRQVVATDTTTGVIRWQYTPPGTMTVSLLQLSGKRDVVFVLGQRAGTTHIVAVDSWTGLAQWSDPVNTNRTDLPSQVAVIAEPQTLVLLFTATNSRIACFDTTGADFCKASLDVSGINYFTYFLPAATDAPVSAAPHDTLPPSRGVFASLVLAQTSGDNNQITIWTLQASSAPQQSGNPINLRSIANVGVVTQVAVMTDKTFAVTYASSGAVDIADVVTGGYRSPAPFSDDTLLAFGLANITTSAADVYGIAAAQTTYITGFYREKSGISFMFALFAANATVAWSRNVTDENFTPISAGGSMTLIGGQVAYFALQQGVSGYVRMPDGEILFSTEGGAVTQVPQFATFSTNAAPSPAPWTESLFADVPATNVAMRITPLWWLTTPLDKVQTVLYLKPAGVLVVVFEQSGLQVVSTFWGTPSNKVSFKARTNPVTAFAFGDRVFVGFRDQPGGVGPSRDVVQIYDLSSDASTIGFTSEVLMPTATSSFGYTFSIDPADASNTAMPNVYSCIGNQVVKIDGSTLPAVTSISTTASCSGRPLSIAGGQLAVADASNTVYLISTATPLSISWRYQIELLAGDPVLGGGYVWVGSSSGNLYAMNGGAIAGSTAVGSSAAYPIQVTDNRMFVVTQASLLVLSPYVASQPNDRTGNRFVANFSSPNTGSMVTCTAFDPVTQFLVVSRSVLGSGTATLTGYNFQYRTSVWTANTAAIYDCSQLYTKNNDVHAAGAHLDLFTGLRLLDFDYPYFSIMSELAVVAFADGGVHYTKVPAIPVPNPLPGIPPTTPAPTQPWRPLPSVYTVAGFAVAVSIGIILLCIASVLIVLRSWRMQHERLPTEEEVREPATAAPQPVANDEQA